MQMEPCRPACSGAGSAGVIGQRGQGWASAALIGHSADAALARQVRLGASREPQKKDAHGPASVRHSPTFFERKTHV